MTIRELEIVVLEHDMPSFGLQRGDIGSVVEVYPPDAMEVEFVAPSGRTLALVTLKRDQVRQIGPGDVLAVRELHAA